MRLCTPSHLAIRYMVMPAARAAASSAVTAADASVRARSAVWYSFQACIRRWRISWWSLGWSVLTQMEGRGGELFCYGMVPTTQILLIVYAGIVAYAKRTAYRLVEVQSHQNTIAIPPDNNCPVPPTV